MKKSFILTILSVILCFGQVYAKPVDEQTAKAVGRTFLLTGKTTLTQINSLDLVYRAASKSGSPMAAGKPVNYFYVFNINGGQGFVIVSADDAVTPVLGYSGETGFNPSDMAPNVAKWLEGYKDEIRYVIEQKVPATQEILYAWEQLKQGNAPVISNNTKRGKRAVSPLLQTKWNQMPYYNAMCPYDNNQGERTVTGCVATAMAQVMKYWNYPENGSGFHSYNHNSYGTLSANFGTTAYQWSSMPNTINSNNSAIATLMYHVGVSVDMNYGVASTGGSGAYVITDQSPVEHCSEYALKTYFGYKSTLQGVQRANYTQTQWLNLIIAEMDASRPVIYAGFGSGGGHCFVADGYDNNNYIHFNWGWGGAYDGFFSINALNPAGVGTGGGTGGFNSGHQAIIGLEPPSGGGGGGGGGTDYDMRVYNDVTPSSSTIYYGQSFSVTTNIANLGTSDFSGDYTAAIFDNQNTFIDHVEIKTGQSLQSGFAYSNDLVFENSGMLGMLPGTYTVIMFYRPDGGNWIQLGDYNSYNNYAQITVINPGSIELNSAMTVTPAEALVKGKTASVNLNLLNNSGSNFTGSYMVGLYTLEGAFVQAIGTLNENNGLPDGYTYNPPYLTFNCPEITADPGTYLMAVLHQKTGAGSWSLTGSSNFQNPVKVTVIENSLPPDPYEVNNTPGTATNLTMTFSGNAAAKTTIGSSCHTGSDYDYYKISLDAGYNYTVNARLHDLYNSGNGKTYTLDALFSYSTDGSSWSDAYDYTMPGAISVNGQGTVYFQVAPYFTGNVGTYLLDISVTREPKVGLESVLADKIAVYPNPAKDVVSVDLGAFEGTVSNMQLVNLQGQPVYDAAWQNGIVKTNISLQQFAAGVYFLQLHTDKGIVSKKIIVNQ